MSFADDLRAKRKAAIAEKKEKMAEEARKLSGREKYPKEIRDIISNILEKMNSAAENRRRSATVYHLNICDFPLKANLENISNDSKLSGTAKSLKKYLEETLKLQCTIKKIKPRLARGFGMLPITIYAKLIARW